MLYMISSSSLTYTQCKKIASTISPVLFNAHGLNRNCSRTVLFSTYNQGELNVTHPYHLQGQEKLHFLFHHFRDYDTVGKLIDISRRHTLFELGINNNFLSLQLSKYQDFVTPTWITSLWEYVSACKSTIEFTTTTTYTLPRQINFISWTKCSHLI